MECTIVGPATDPRLLSPADSFFNQIIAVLNAKNFIVPGTEISSGITHCSCEMDEVKVLRYL